MNAAEHPIKHVVVLMLENNSFDRMLGALQHQQPQLEGITAPGQRWNVADGNAYRQVPIRVDEQGAWTFDPGHEHADAIAQLGKYSASTDSYGMDGFAQDAFEQLPTQSTTHAQSVMSYFADSTNPAYATIPVLQGLAKRYAVCDHWFSAMPGPTLPNRFFATHGTAFGEVLMPGKPSFADITLGLELLAKSKTEESIFSLCQAHGITSEIYCAGQLPFCAFSKGVELGEVKNMAAFAAACREGQLPQLSWIEPDYAFFGGAANSQHPPHNPVYGEHLIWTLYNQLKASPQWEQTLFIVTYDENGGFYDHVSPPTAPAPDDRNASQFQRYGARVPAVLISPKLRAGALDSTVYDHTSLLAYLCDLFQLSRQALGNRVVKAQHFGNADLWYAANEAKRTPDLTLAEPILPPTLPATPSGGGKWEKLGEVMTLLLERHQKGALQTGWMASIQSMAAKAVRLMR